MRRVGYLPDRRRRRFNPATARGETCAVGRKGQAVHGGWIRSKDKITCPLGQSSSRISPIAAPRAMVRPSGASGNGRAWLAGGEAGRSPVRTGFRSAVAVPAIGVRPGPRVGHPATRPCTDHRRCRGTIRRTPPVRRCPIALAPASCRPAAIARMRTRSLAWFVRAWRACSARVPVWRSHTATSLSVVPRPTDANRLPSGETTR